MAIKKRSVRRPLKVLKSSVKACCLVYMSECVCVCVRARDCMFDERKCNVMSTMRAIASRKDDCPHETDKCFYE